MNMNIEAMCLWWNMTGRALFNKANAPKDKHDWRKEGF
jgi:hypothetical protein